MHEGLSALFPVASLIVLLELSVFDPPHDIWSGDASSAWHWSVDTHLPRNSVVRVVSRVRVPTHRSTSYIHPCGALTWWCILRPSRPRGFCALSGILQLNRSKANSQSLLWRTCTRSPASHSVPTPHSSLQPPRHNALRDSSQAASCKSSSRRRHTHLPARVCPPTHQLRQLTNKQPVAELESVLKESFVADVTKIVHSVAIHVLQLAVSGPSVHVL